MFFARLVTTIIWIPLGLILWVPLLLRYTVTVIALLVFSAVAGHKVVDDKGVASRRAIGFFSNGFSIIWGDFAATSPEDKETLGNNFVDTIMAALVIYVPAFFVLVFIWGVENITLGGAKYWSNYTPLAVDKFGQVSIRQEAAEVNLSVRLQELLVDKTNILAYDLLLPATALALEVCNQTESYKLKVMVKARLVEADGSHRRYKGVLTNELLHTECQEIKLSGWRTTKDWSDERLRQSQIVVSLDGKEFVFR